MTTWGEKLRETIGDAISQVECGCEWDAECNRRANCACQCIATADRVVAAILTMDDASCEVCGQPVKLLDSAYRVGGLTWHFDCFLAAAHTVDLHTGGSR